MDEESNLSERLSSVHENVKYSVKLNDLKIIIIFLENHTIENKAGGTSKVGAISKARKAQSSKYAQDVFMENSCFRTSASYLVKRNIVRIQRQKFGQSALLRILRGGTSIKSKGDPLETKNIFEKKSVPKKNLSVSSAFANARKSFWLKQGFEPATAGCPLNRLKSVLKSGTYRVDEKKRKTSHCISRALFLRKAPTKKNMIKVDENLFGG